MVLFLHKLVASVVLPPVGPALLMTIGVFSARAVPRLGRILFFLGLLATVGLALPIVADLLMAPYEDRMSPLAENSFLDDQQAIVIIGAGRILGATEWGGETMSALTLQHVRYGAKLVRRYKLPVLVSGGKPGGGKIAEATMMADALRNEYNLPVRWVEPNSVDTTDNAVQSAAILKPLGITRIVLATDVTHMPRARLAFERQGFIVRPAPMNFQTSAELTWTDFLPQATAYGRSTWVLHEWLGQAWAHVAPNSSP